MPARRFRDLDKLPNFIILEDEPPNRNLLNKKSQYYLKNRKYKQFHDPSEFSSIDFIGSLTNAEV